MSEKCKIYVIKLWKRWGLLGGRGLKTKAGADRCQPGGLFSLRGKLFEYLGGEEGPEKERYLDLMEILTPICKSWCSDQCFDVAK